MSFKEKLIVSCSLIIFVIILGFLLSENRAFDGDELGTLTDIEKIHKPVPYKKIIIYWINLLKPIDVNEVFFLRLSSLFFTAITIFLWFFFYIRSRLESILFFIVVITSSFFLYQSIYFRYYSYYILSSSITFFLLINFFQRFSINLKLLLCLVGLFISPLIFHVLNGIQFAVFFLYTLIFEKIKSLKIRLFILIPSLSLICLIVLYPFLFWEFFNWLNIMEALTITTQTQNLHGFNKSILIKPIYAVYQMFFGFDLAPTLSLSILIFTFTLFMILTIQFYGIFIYDRKIFIQYILIGIIPFLIIYLFIQVISFPGFTQLESKHGILLYPVLIGMIIKIHKYMSKKIFFITFCLLISSQLIGMYHTFNLSNTDWSYILNKIDTVYFTNNKTKILMDGRSTGPFKFHNENKIDKKNIFFTWDIEKTQEVIKDKNNSDIILLLNDYKSYTKLSLKQNWNAANNSYNRVDGLNSIIQNLNEYYYLYDSYVNYPTFLYFLKRKKDPSNRYSIGVWEHHLKDLKLPITTENSLLSSILIKPLDSINIKYSDNLILNFENCQSVIQNQDKIGFYKINNTKYDLIKGVNIWDLFSEFDNIEIKNEHVFFSWYHRPLISGSINYFGSYYGHKARIYKIKITEEDSNENILIKNISKNCSIRIWI